MALYMYNTLFSIHFFKIENNYLLMIIPKQDDIHHIYKWQILSAQHIWFRIPKRTMFQPIAMHIQMAPPPPHLSSKIAPPHRPKSYPKKIPSVREHGS